MIFKIILIISWDSFYSISLSGSKSIFIPRSNSDAIDLATFFHVRSYAGLSEKNRGPNLEVEKQKEEMYSNLISKPCV